MKVSLPKMPKDTLHRLANSFIFAVGAVILLFVIPEFYYRFAPTSWFVKIDRVSAYQSSDKAVTYIVYREVGFNRGIEGRFRKTLYCSENDTARYVSQSSITFERYNKKTEDEVHEVKIDTPIDERFKGCTRFYYAVDYFITMPNGIERTLENPYYTDDFEVNKNDDELEPIVPGLFSNDNAEDVVGSEGHDASPSTVVESRVEVVNAREESVKNTEEDKSDEDANVEVKLDALPKKTLKEVDELGSGVLNTAGGLLNK